MGKTERERGDLEKENVDMVIDGMETNEEVLHFSSEQNMETEQHVTVEEMETDETEALEQLNAYGKMEVDEEVNYIACTVFNY